MQFSLKIICNLGITEIVNQRVTTLVNNLSLPDDYTFSPYWKDNACAIMEFSAKIHKPNFSKIRQHIQFIAGTENVSECCSAGAWECGYYVSFDEMDANQNAVFVVCNVFEV